MRAWVVNGVGSPADVLELRDIGVPEPGPGFVRLQVDAAAVGLPDVLMCAGTYPLTPELPFTPGQEVVGTVTAVGPDVDPGLVGTRRMGVTAFYLGSGGFAEEALAAAATTFAAPASLRDADAAGFHIPFHTGWNALVDRGRIQPGETLAVLGGAGGSGSAAVLLGRALGARVIAVVGGAEKAEFCRALGADEIIDHREVDAAEQLRVLTGGRGADLVFDPVGGAAGEQAATAVAGEGRFLLIGFASGRWPTIDPAALVSGNFSLMGVYAGAFGRDHVEAVYAQLFALIGEGRLGPLPTTIADFEQLPEALERLRARSVLGKTVVRVGDPSR